MRAQVGEELVLGARRMVRRRGDGAVGSVRERHGAAARSDAELHLRFVAERLAGQPGQRGADVAAAGYRREIVEEPQVVLAGELLHDAEREGRRADTAAGKAEGAESAMAGVEPMRDAPRGDIAALRAEQVNGAGIELTLGLSFGK